MFRPLNWSQHLNSPVCFTDLAVDIVTSFLVSFSPSWDRVSNINPLILMQHTFEVELFTVDTEILLNHSRLSHPESPVFT